MEFLVNIKISIPDDTTDDEYRDLAVRERRMAAERAREGHLVRMWRVPGRRENWGLWRAEDPTELHGILSELPVWPWMDIEVIGLANHPVDPLSDGEVDLPFVAGGCAQ